ncbi:MAG: hypothetical protein BGO43_08030 [Gammaproteobacteria bacterium 39-13]|nr:hypothetical protein [Gammaproteobacteria bacterium]OJV93116.1 MAG: hypothetical protein BGO43_08030 [Gammaproteobacteria bacterium 39-13]
MKEKCQHHEHSEKHHALSLNDSKKHSLFDIIVNYKPLIIIIIFSLSLPLAHTLTITSDKFMYGFMGYFFIFLSLFKFFDLKGFVEAFSTYDLISKHLPLYGYLYPFIEFFLGIGYLAQVDLFFVNFVTVMLMLISGIGILKSVFSGQKIKCACLGTTLNVPLSTISILENFGMGAMAAYNLFFLF